MNEPAKLTIWTLHSFANLVKQLRASQKIYGEGYKPGSNFSAIRTLENEVDAAIAWTEQHILPMAPPPKS
jgi:hypothetical protein